MATHLTRLSLDSIQRLEQQLKPITYDSQAKTIHPNHEMSALDMVRIHN